jgi:CoA:oxalate CoA-transferase
MADRPLLEGVRILDHSLLVAGSYCGRLLAELGAEVIKIEPPFGERGRRQIVQKEGESLLFVFLNANKKSITLNLKHPKGKEIFFELLKRSDVFIENYAPGAMDRLGIGYDQQTKVNPRIIYASINGFGSYGPYKDLVAFDYLVQAMVGLVDTNGFPEKRVRIGPALTDWTSGVYCALGIISALYHRNKTGEGQKVETSMFDVGFAFLQEHLTYSIGSLPIRLGNAYQGSAPNNIYKTRDGEIFASIFSDEMWDQFLSLRAESKNSVDASLSTVYGRAHHLAEVDRIVSEWTESRTSEEAIKELRKIGAACGPVKSIEEMFEDPHVKARGLLKEVEHPKIGKVSIPVSPLRLSRTPPEVKSGGPLLGADNTEVYSSLLGYSDADIRNMKSDGII